MPPPPSEDALSRMDPPAEESGEPADKATGETPSAQPGVVAISVWMRVFCVPEGRPPPVMLLNEPYFSIWWRGTLPQGTQPAETSWVLDPNYP